MKILWVVNMVFPDAAKALGKETSASGGWLLDLSRGIAEREDIELGVMTYYDGSEFKAITVNGIRHFIFPGGGRRLLHYSERTEGDCRKVVELFKPDIIHLHGTEYAPALAMTKVAPEVKMILTIQGIINRIAQEYYGGLTIKEIIFLTRFKDIVKMKTIFNYKYLFNKNAKRETEVLKRVKFVTGRTDWDKATMLSINPELEYFRCNYNLRDAFYRAEKWDVNKMEPRSIYASSALYPLKGLDILIKAVGIVKRYYPDVKLYIPGGNAEGGRITNLSGYLEYNMRLIKELGIEDNVVFTGKLGPDEVVQRLQKANVFAVTSAIEGASASLCEAMMVGTPAISSFRGGMTDLLTDKVDGFTYDFPEYPMLAHRIMEIFENNEMACEFSMKAMVKAEIRHDREKNPREMVEVYKTILQS